MRTCITHPERPQHAKGLCKTCYNESKSKRVQKELPKITDPELEKATKEKARNSTLVRKYGITSKTVEQMRREQKGKCAICGKVTKNLNVDHHHDTDTVRGLLCGTCNRGIGNLKECTTTMLSAIRYILYWSTRYGDKPHV